ncbi:MULTISPECIES: response regulator [Nocardiopsis]|uniref:Two component transcriptional regulator, LuxR family n=4 Tax=Nocardiopsis TaxID=2013 RepID=D7AUN2_NOCDD|nr:response regulator transcription factor [Nocardiopsis dassonvillei]ADH67612.1 two component transcriptional regulator, LuxR family [Nocardiopsis dassonvillei subsp. dassonvillei DSM 43111]APC35798.1 DNA-binding response regulator [Nocardiopsis dassonvillei]VEI87975.1 Response regulator protein vraR [Nocardiopsis dassonvillei]
MIAINLVDDEALIRAGLAALINAEDDMRVTGQADDGADVPDLVRRTRPDLVLMDVRMPRLDGIQATRTLHTTLTHPPRVIVLTTFDNDDYVWGALRAGAHGFLLKRTPPEDILAAIRLAHRGDTLLFPTALRHLAATQPAAPTPAARAVATLTQRESQTLTLMAQGLTNAEIADRLFLGTETVKTHVSHILTKLGVRDRTQAVIAAYDSGLIRPNTGR